MPWSLSNPPDAIKNKSKGAIEAGVKAANNALERGLSNQDAVFAAVAAANAWEKKHSVKKAIVEKPNVPLHLKAILEAKKSKEETIVLEKETTPIERKQIHQAFLGKNAVTPDSERSLVNVQWDKQGRLILSFDDGKQIITDPVPVSEHIEQFVTISAGSTTGEVSGLTNPVEYLDFQENPLSEVQPRRLQWNPEEGTLDLGMNSGAIVQHIGLETYIRVKNTSDALISDGNPVMYDGSAGNSGHLKVKLASAQLCEPSSLFLGLATADIAVNDFGFVTNFGLVKGINTTGSLFGEVWQDGDTLYLHPTIAGRLTNILPESSRVIVVGYVVHAHPNGQIFSRPSFGSSLQEIDDVKIINPQNNDVLSYDSVSASWVNKPAGSGGQGLDGKSAYEIALDNGFVGTEQEWLDSLVGPIGPQGPQGEQGPIGPIGPQGPQGDSALSTILMTGVDSNYEVLETDSFIKVIALANVIIDLPLSETVIGKTFIIKHSSANPLTTTIRVKATVINWPTYLMLEKIDDSVEQITLNQFGSTVTLLSTGLGWEIISSYKFQI